MRIVLESTTMFVTVNGVNARIWEGVTTDDVPVHAYITRLAVPEGRPADDYATFERELIECRKPSPDVSALPSRLIL